MNCSEYCAEEGPVREAWEKKCSSRVMRGGNWSFVLAMVEDCGEWALAGRGGSRVKFSGTTYGSKESLTKLQASCST